MTIKPCPKCEAPTKRIKYRGKMKTTHLKAADTKRCRARLYTASSR